MLTALFAAATANCNPTLHTDDYYYCTDNSDIETPQQVNNETLCAPYASGYSCCIASFHINDDLYFRRCYPDNTSYSYAPCDVDSISIDNSNPLATNYAKKCDGNQDASLTPASTTTTTATTTVVSPAGNNRASPGA